MTDAKSPSDEVFDVIIVGGGPAALAAAIYAGRSQLKTLILERQYLGGQVALTYEVENYPGFPDGIDGPELTERMEKQARRFGAEIRTEEVKGIYLEDDMKRVRAAHDHLCPVLILATGADPRKLDVPGENELRGRGVSYCATCDAPFFRDKRVVVVGGGDAALKEGIYLTKFASEVLIVHRRLELRAEKILQDEARANDKITFLLNRTVERINGDERVEGVDLKDVETGEIEALPCDGVFVFIGNVPNTDFLTDVFPQDSGYEIETDSNMMTRVEGLFAIGDVRRGSYRQIATAVGEGATAAMAAEHYLASRSWKSVAKD